MDIGLVPVVCKSILQTYFKYYHMMEIKLNLNANVFEKANAEANNALVRHNDGDPNNTKSVEGFDFFEDSDGQIGSISGGGGIGPNN